MQEPCFMPPLSNRESEGFVSGTCDYSQDRVDRSPSRRLRRLLCTSKQSDRAIWTGYGNPQLSLLKCKVKKWVSGNIKGVQNWCLLLKYKFEYSNRNLEGLTLVFLPNGDNVKENMGQNLAGLLIAWNKSDHQGHLPWALASSFSFLWKEMFMRQYLLVKLLGLEFLHIIESQWAEKTKQYFMAEWWPP